MPQPKVVGIFIAGSQIFAKFANSNSDFELNDKKNIN